MAGIIRVLVVDDSALIRQMLTRALAMDPRIEIVGSARTGVEAIERARQLNPDVITLDIEMPELTGLEALPHIRKHTDARVVMLSSLDDPDTTYRALSLGAVDFIAKPSAGMASSITDLADVLIKKIKVANRVTPGHAARVVESLAEAAEVHFSDGDSEPSGGPLSACVAIAASTGGPPALERVFAGLTPSLPAAYVIVQHLPAGFSASLAKRLASVSDVRVAEAVHGQPLECGHAYIAPHGLHMLVDRESGRPSVVLSDAPSMHGVRPAADLLFESVAKEFRDRSIGVVLTGMGADGAQGALSIKKAGGDTIAQDEGTSVVWGMPGAAVRIGAVTRSVPIGLVAAEVRRAVRSRVPLKGA